MTSPPAAHSVSTAPPPPEPTLRSGNSSFSFCSPPAELWPQPTQQHLAAKCHASCQAAKVTLLWDGNQDGISPTTWDSALPPHIMHQLHQCRHESLFKRSSFTISGKIPDAPPAFPLLSFPTESHTSFSDGSSAISRRSGLCLTFPS